MAYARIFVAQEVLVRAAESTKAIRMKFVSFCLFVPRPPSLALYYCRFFATELLLLASFVEILQCCRLCSNIFIGCCDK